MSRDKGLETLVKTCRSEVSFSLAQIYHQINTPNPSCPSDTGNSTASSEFDPHNAISDVIGLLNPLRSYLVSHSAYLSPNDMQYGKRQLQFLFQVILDVSSRLLTTPSLSLNPQFVTAIDQLQIQCQIEDSLISTAPPLQTPDESIESSDTSISASRSQIATITQQPSVPMRSSTNSQIVQCASLEKVDILFITHAQYAWILQLVSYIMRSFDLGSDDLVNESRNCPLPPGGLFPLTSLSSEVQQSIFHDEIFISSIFHTTTQKLLSNTISGFSQHLFQLAALLEQPSDQSLKRGFTGRPAYLYFCPDSDIPLPNSTSGTSISHQPVSLYPSTHSVQPPIILQNSQQCTFIQCSSLFIQNFLATLFHQLCLLQPTINPSSFVHLVSSIFSTSISALPSSNSSSISPLELCPFPNFFVASVSASNLTNTHLFFPHIMTSCHLSHLTHCVIAVICHQLRLHHFSACFVLAERLPEIPQIPLLSSNVTCSSIPSLSTHTICVPQTILMEYLIPLEPILEHSTQVIFAPFGLFFAQYYTPMHSEVAHDDVEDQSNTVNVQQQPLLLGSLTTFRISSLITHDFDLLQQPTSVMTTTSDIHHVSHAADNENSQLENHQPSVSRTTFLPFVQHNDHFMYFEQFIVEKTLFEHTCELLYSCLHPFDGKNTPL